MCQQNMIFLCPETELLLNDEIELYLVGIAKNISGSVQGIRQDTFDIL